MKATSLRIRPLATALLAALFLPASLHAQTATTTPVGFITVTISAAANANTPSNTAISFPLYATAAFQGAITTVDSATTFTLSGATFTAGQFGPYSTTQPPYLVRVKVGAQAGKFWLITGNSPNQLTVQNPDGGTTNVASVLSVGDSCEILAANTLGSILGTSSPIVSTGASASAPGADNVLLFNGATWDTFYHNGTNWRKSGNLANQNNTPVYPDESVFLIRKALTPTSLTVMGTVPSTTEKTDLNGGSVPSPGYTYISNRFPTDTTLAALALHTTAGWINGASANGADNVLIFNPSTQTWDTFYYNGTNWRKSGNLANQNTAAIPAGTGLFVIRTGSGTSTLTQVLPYTP